MAKEKDFDLGIDNAQFDAGIQQASEFEQSKQLAEDIRQNIGTLKSINLSLRLLGRHMVELEQDADCLSADLNDKVRQLREALTIVLPPKTTDHLEYIFQTFCDTFDKMLQKSMDEAVTKSELSFNVAEQRMKQQTDRIVKSSRLIALPPMFCYICLTLLLCLATFLGIVWWANTTAIHSPQLQIACYIFAALPIVISVCLYFVLRKSL